ncbi:MAG TPA: AI-2E family transporter [Anaerolineae bacterium]|nr:AI-2E family transporter [Anaerolineae bacterium]
MNHDQQPASLLRLLLGLTCVAVLIIALRLFAAHLGLILFGLLFAIILTPLYHWLQRKGVPSWLAMLIMVIGLVGGGLGFIWLLVVSLKQLAGSVETYRSLLAERLAPLQAWLASIGVDLSGVQMEDFFDAKQVIAWVAGSLGTLAGAGATALFILAVIFFALIEASDLGARLRASLGANHPVAVRTREFTHLAVKYIALRAYINVLVGTAVTIFMFVMGIDFAPLWGVLTFFLGFIPYIGIFISTALPTVLAFIQYGLGHAIWVIIGVTVINVSTENLVAPKIVGKGLSLSPLVVFLAFFFWSWVFGAVGMFLSMPLTVLVIFILQSYEETRWLADLAGASRAMPAAVEPEQAVKAEVVET